MTTIAGSGVSGFSGDGDLATTATLASPSDLAADFRDNVYVADKGNNRIRAVEAVTKKISTLVVTPGSFDGSIGVDGSGNLYFTPGWTRIEIVDRTTPAVTLAGPATVGPTTGIADINISAAAGDPWIALRQGNWLSLEQTQGVGPGILRVAVANNPTLTERTATVYVNGVGHSIRQAGITPTVTRSATAATAGPLAGSGTITVSPNIAEYTTWTVTGAPSWLSASKSGNTVYWSTSPNTGTSARTAKLTIGDKLFTLTQSAGCSAVVNFASGTGTPAAAGGSVKLALVIQKSPEFAASRLECSWTATSPVPWLEPFPLQGSQSADIFVTVYPNFGSTQRVASVAVGAAEAAFSQAAMTGVENTRFVRRAYFNALRRLPGTADETFHSNRLASGVTRAQMYLDFLAAAEFRAGGAFVTALYRVLLRRVPERTGWAFQLNSVVSSGIPQVNLTGAFLQSAEWKLRQDTDNSDAAFVDSLYREVLGRAPTDPERFFQFSQLAGGTSRAQLATSFLSIPEFYLRNGTLLDALHAFFVVAGRDPNAGELAALESRLRTTPLVTILDELVRSAEHVEALK